MSRRLNVPPRRPLMGLASALVAVVFFQAGVAGVVYAHPPSTGAGGSHAGKPRNENTAKHDQAEAVDGAPYGIDRGNCNRDLIGSTLDGGDGKSDAILSGRILGALIGGTIGRSMDQVDQNCVGQILEYAEDGRSVVWSNPTVGARFQVTPAGTYRDGNGNYCREYTTASAIGGKIQEVYGTACRQPDGSWQFGG